MTGNNTKALIGRQCSQAEKYARAAHVLRQAEHKAGMCQETGLAGGNFYTSASPKATLINELGVPLSPGSLIGMSGSTSLLLAMVAAAADGGGWVAVMGMPTLGAAAAADFGIDLTRMILVPHPGPHAAAATAALIDGCDVVVIGQGVSLTPGQRRSLLGRARRWRTTMFTPLWPQVPTRLEARPVSFAGVGEGRGYLSERRIAVRHLGRGGERVVRVTARGVARGVDEVESRLRRVG